MIVAFGIVMKRSVNSLNARIVDSLLSGIDVIVQHRNLFLAYAVVSGVFFFPLMTASSQQATSPISTPVFTNRQDSASHSLLDTQGDTGDSGCPPGYSLNSNGRSYRPSANSDDTSGSNGSNDSVSSDVSAPTKYNEAKPIGSDSGLSLRDGSVGYLDPCGGWADDTSLLQRKRAARSNGEDRRDSFVYQPTEFQLLVQGRLGHRLNIFGSNLFRTSPSTFAPIENAPVTQDYVIGPGDELRVQLWGQVNHRGSYIVDRTGSIVLPEVGVIHVSGIPFSKLPDFLRSQLDRVYRNFDLNVNLGQLRSIQVFVVGYVRQPGNYTISPLSTLLNALFASGGPLPQGSLRKIEVRRNGSLISTFDLYDLLLKGDRSKDIQLVSGDVIFIPESGPQVAVSGSVNNPAIYELRSEDTATQVLALAGGVSSVASKSPLQIERISEHSEQSIEEVDLTINPSSRVQDGDVIFVKSIMPNYRGAVTLRGNVANPGRYPWHLGMRVSDLIPNQESLVTRAYYKRLNQLGQPDNKYDVAGDVQADSQPVESMADQGRAFGAKGLNSSRSSVADALVSENSQSDSVTTNVVINSPDIDWDYAVIERQDKTTLTTQLVPFNLGKLVLDHETSQDMLLLSGDIVTVFSKKDIRVPSAKQTKFVRLDGEFSQAGIYSVEPGEKLHHLLLRAGGFTSEADLFASQFTRESVRKVEEQRLNEYLNSLEASMSARTSALLSKAVTERDAAAAQSSAAEDRLAIAKLRNERPTGRIVLQLKPEDKDVSSLPDIELEDGDRFVVPKQPSNISVEGQVYSANAFVYQDDKRVRDYLRLAGGEDRLADTRREFILRADGSVLSYQAVSKKRNGGNFGGTHVVPGDTIVVPPKLDKGATLRNLLDFSTIIEGFGLGAAAISVLK